MFLPTASSVGVCNQDRLGYVGLIRFMVWFAEEGAGEELSGDVPSIDKCIADMYDSGADAELNIQQIFV